MSNIGTIVIAITGVCLIITMIKIVIIREKEYKCIKQINDRDNSFYIVFKEYLKDLEEYFVSIENYEVADKCQNLINKINTYLGKKT